MEASRLSYRTILASLIIGGIIFGVLGPQLAVLSWRTRGDDVQNTALLRSVEDRLRTVESKVNAVETVFPWFALQNLLTRLTRESPYTDFKGRGFDGIDPVLIPGTDRVRNPYGSRLLGPFNRVIWAFWHSGESGASAFVKTCLQRMRDINGPQWQVRVLSDDSVQSYLEADELEAFLYMKRKWSVEHAADLLRLILIKKYGGVWMDASSIPLESQEDILIENGLIDTENTTESQRKDVLVFSIDRQEEGFEKRAPVIENWYMAARKNALFIDRWIIKSLEFWLKVDREIGGYGVDAGVFIRHFKPLFQAQGFSIAAKSQQDAGAYHTQHFASLWVIQEERLRWLQWFWQHFGLESQARAFLQPTNSRSPTEVAFPAGDKNGDSPRWINKKPSSFEDFNDGDVYFRRAQNPGIANSFRLKILDCRDGPFKLQVHNDLWGWGRSEEPRWVNKDGGAMWHANDPPRYFVKLIGTTRRVIEAAIQKYGVHNDSLIARLLPNTVWPKA